MSLEGYTLQITWQYFGAISGIKLCRELFLIQIFETQDKKLWNSLLEETKHARSLEVATAATVATYLPNHSFHVHLKSESQRKFIHILQ